MVAAEASGLSGIALTDHCPVGDDPFGRRDRYGFEETHETRRRYDGYVTTESTVGRVDPETVTDRELDEMERLFECAQ